MIDYKNYNNNLWVNATTINIKKQLIDKNSMTTIERPKQQFIDDNLYIQQFKDKNAYRH